MRWLVWFLLALGPAPAALAAGRIAVEAEAIEWAGLQASGLRLRWSPRAGGGEFSAAAGRITGLGAAGELADLTLDCADLRFSGDTLDCRRGRARGTLGRFGPQDTAFSLRADSAGNVVVQVASVALAGGSAQGSLDLRGTAWKLGATLSDLNPGAAAELAQPWLTLPAGFSVGGQISGALQMHGSAAELRGIDTNLAITRLDLANTEGTVATEQLAGELRLAADLERGGAMTLTGRLELNAGQAYADPVFLDFGQHALSVTWTGQLAAGGQRLSAREFTLEQAGVVQMSGAADFDLSGGQPLASARLQVADLQLAAALPVWVQPFLISTAFKDLAGAGRIHGTLEFAAGLPSRADLSLEGITLDSANGSFGVDGLSGLLRWFDDARRGELGGELEDQAFRSWLDWRSARLWGIEFGAVTLPFATSGRHFRLLEPVVLPLFDGGLAIETLRLRHAGTEQMYLRFDATLRPVSVARIARAFAWPEFNGTLAGRIPNLQLARGEVTLGGNLEAEVFGGSIVVKNLRLRDPLGRFPRLYADLEIDRLDLEQLTNTFSFGMITGRLSGRIAGLETFAWMPETFDARFYTTPGDRTPHRISQRAVTNLSSIGGGSGGGVAAALQGGFLRFFETFRYDRLGLNCRLANDVCRMSGVERTDGGYYIVKGAGIPRIDVIGSESRVGWSRLVRQLGAIMESEVVIR
ncbi:MAG: hypothetical protein FJ191_08960 [Gammaproteobacteria bacterium]|nr:hypothetical protein [Gammaproteobacteria bacterium]